MPTYLFIFWLLFFFFRINRVTLHIQQDLNALTCMSPDL